MDLFKSYAHEVAGYHPLKARDELFAEVYDALCEEYADWQAAHPGASQEAFLDACREHPMRFAARLADSRNNYLVGPELYYSLLSALKAGAAISAGVFLLLAVVTALSSGAYLGSFLRMLLAYPETLLWVSASILGVFIAMERSGERASWLDRWKASDLKPVDSHATIPRSDVFFDLGLSALLLLWISGVLDFPALFWHDNVRIEGWTFALPGLFLWLVAGLLFFDIGFALARLRRRFWSSALRGITIAANLAWIAVLSWAAAHGPVLELPEPLASEVPDVAAMVNRVLAIVLYVVCLVLAVEAAHHAWKMFQDWRGGRPAAAPPA